MTPTLSFSDLYKAASRPVFPLDLPEARRRYTFNGSSAIHAALLDMQLEPGATVLLPAYCCGAELAPFELLDCDMVFYDIRPDFSISADEIVRLLNAQPDIRVVLLTHYLGLAQPEAEEIAEHCRFRNVRLIEDCAHALYAERNGKPVGQAGDYAIFSMRKSLPLSEGGAVTSQRDLRPESCLPSSRLSVVAWISRVSYSFQQGARRRCQKKCIAMKGSLIIAVMIFPAVLVKLVRRTGLLPESRWLTPDVEGVAAVAVYGQGISAFSQRLLKNADGHRIRSRRRVNHAHWLSRVEGIEGVEPIHRSLPPGACPLYFLVSVSDPASCVKKLALSDIEAFNWWQHLSSQIRWDDFPVARQYKQSLLALPLHQQLEEIDVTRMASCLSIAVGTGIESP